MNEPAKKKIPNPADHSPDNPYSLEGRGHKQAGFDILVGVCPKCGNHVAGYDGSICYCICGMWHGLTPATAQPAS